MTFDHKILDLWLLIIYYNAMSINHTLAIGEGNMPRKTKNHNLEKIDNKCYKCAYFVKHYANLNGMFYLVAGCMHCINTDLSLSERKKRMLNTIKCENWQPEIIQIERRRESIETYLSITAEKLQEIAQILKEDNERKK